ncbi:MAG: DUF3604 domain-containing protein [bacterium]|nr:DUF3604 domain-containing protein [bacterium]
MIKGLLIGGVGLIVLAVLLVFATVRGVFGEDEVAGDAAPVRRPVEAVAAVQTAQDATIASLGAPASKQILFGDFHVHTTFSFDSFLINLPMSGGAGSRPPSDACDFARYCSALDFWSINDHAEALTPRLWEETVESVRQCNEVAGDPADPDLVTYLGWEWSQIGSTPENHYGHKNVVILGTEDDEIPSRPIGSRSPGTARALNSGGLGLVAGLIAANGERGHDFIRLVNQVRNTPACSDDVPVRELPRDCLESTTDPEGLFAKLDDWGFESLVIPHGTAWGIYTPAGSDWRKQLAGHDPERQKLVEIYSGHGNSEKLPRWREIEIAADGSLTCPMPRDGYLPSCWRAGELIEARCLEVGEDADECQRRAADARRNYAAAYQAGWKTLPGYETTDWLNAGQAPGSFFQPSFNYRPRSSVQYMLAVRDFSDPKAPKRFDFGFLGSSDTHTASGGQGYKEFARGEMSDGRGRREGQPTGGGGVFGGSAEADSPVAESVPFVFGGESPLQLFEIERASAYFVTGGLVAVHSGGRDRQAIWDALERKEVYTTSGRRTLLWFDMIDGSSTIPMGSTTRQDVLPRFRVRAAGSFEQRPGCPDHAIDALGQQRVDAICRGECYHPGDTRRPISRIEVVRIRPQIAESEPVDGLVEDPWRSFPCPADGTGCVVEFADGEFPEARRDTVYYARAIEAPDQLIHGSNPLGCTFDENGRCVEVAPCGNLVDASDDCLSEAEPRAWSSPIYVDFGSSRPASP